MALANLDKDMWAYEQLVFGRLILLDNFEWYDAAKQGILTKYNHNAGYLILYIKDYETKNTIIMMEHRLVWLYYYGPIFNPYLMINHLDGNKRNNSIYNLELVTNQENVKHAYAIGLNKVSDNVRQKLSERMTGSNNINSKLSEEQVLEIRHLYSKGISKYTLINDYQVSRRCIDNILNRVSYTHI